MPRVAEVMSQNPKVGRIEQPISQILQIMRDEDCGVVPLVNQDNKLVGVVTDRDIALCMLDRQEASIQSIPAQDCVRHREVISVTPEDDLERAIDLMEEHQVRRLPVCDPQGNVIGILSQADIALKSPSKEKVAEVVSEISKQKSSLGAN